MPIQEPTPSPQPEHQTFTRTLVGWTFTRSHDTHFAAAEYPGTLRSVVFSILSSVLVWSFILAVCLLQWRQPSVHDHAAKGYSDAFSCPENYSNSNYVYNELGLTSPLCRKVTHQAYDSWLPEAIRDVNPDQKTL
jgi:hypothetical protein